MSCQRPISNCQRDNYWHRHVQAGKGFQESNVNNFLLCFKRKISRRWVTRILMESISANPLNLGAAMGINGGSGYPREIQLGWKERVELCVLEVIRMFLIYYPQVWKIPPLEFLLAPCTKRIMAGLLFCNSDFIKLPWSRAHHGWFPLAPQRAPGGGVSSFFSPSYLSLFPSDFFSPLPSPEFRSRSMR